MPVRRMSIVCLSALLAACSPSLDWREVVVADAQLLARFPCKPQRLANDSQGLLQCEAGGLRFVLAWQRWSDPRQLQQSLAQAASDAGRRAASTVRALPGAGLPGGATAWPGSGRFDLGADGQQGQLMFWAQGLTGYRAMVIGKRSAAAAAVFFDGLRSAP